VGVNYKHCLVPVPASFDHAASPVQIARTFDVLAKDKWIDPSPLVAARAFAHRRKPSEKEKERLLDQAEASGVRVKFCLDSLPEPVFARTETSDVPLAGLSGAMKEWKGWHAFSVSSAERPGGGAAYEAAYQKLIGSDQLTPAAVLVATVLRTEALVQAPPGSDDILAGVTCPRCHGEALGDFASEAVSGLFPKAMYTGACALCREELPASSLSKGEMVRTAIVLDCGKGSPGDRGAQLPPPFVASLERALGCKLRAIPVWD
jgi:hypothetical protein